MRRSNDVLRERETWEDDLGIYVFRVSNWLKSGLGSDY